MWVARALKRLEGKPKCALAYADAATTCSRKRKLIPLCGTVNNEKLPLLSNSLQAYAVLRLPTDTASSVQRFNLRHQQAVCLFAMGNYMLTVTSTAVK
jgi:hypothetical protein